MAYLYTLHILQVLNGSPLGLSHELYVCKNVAELEKDVHLKDNQILQKLKNI